MEDSKIAIPHEADCSSCGEGGKQASSRFLPVARVCFVAIVLLVCSVPFAGTFVAPTTQTTENRDLAPAPQLIGDEGGPNIDFLNDSGTWFTDHFACRNRLVSADARIRQQVFATSANSQVILGKDGWLFYDGTLPDYQGARETSDRTLDNVAFNLSLIQGYVQSTGAQFRFMLVPNKNTVYAQYMPERYGVPSDNHDAWRLKGLLEERKINYIDTMQAVADAAESGDDQLYYATDTHWNGKGALVGYRLVVQSLPGEFDDYADLEWSEATHTGDLESMLYPSGAQAEKDYVLEPAPEYVMDEGESVEDATVATSSSGTGKLLMFRDSFANALIPLLAPQFEQARFTKMTPYDLTGIAAFQPDVVIWERAERELLDLATEPPYMYAPRTNAIPAKKADQTLGSLEVCRNGGLLDVSGVVDESLRDNADTIFVTLYDGAGDAMGTYVAFRVTTDSDGVSSDLGYQAYLDAESAEDAASLAVSVDIDGELTQIAYKQRDE